MTDFYTPEFGPDHYLRLAFFLDKFAFVMQSLPTPPGDVETEKLMLADVDGLRRQCLAAAAHGVVYPFGFLEGKWDCGIGYADGHPLLGFRFTPPGGHAQLPCHIVFRDADMLRGFVQSLAAKLEQWISSIPPEGLH